MRILCVLFALLVITVTSLARPQEPEKSNHTTTALPLTPTIKNNDTPSGTPASMGKSNEKPNNVIAHTTPSVTTAGKSKEDVVKIGTALTKTAVTPVTTDLKADLSSSAITSSDKITSTTTTIATSVTTTAAPPTKLTSTTINSITTAASPITEIVTTNNSNIIPTVADITTAVPVTTACPPPSDRHFDGLSFLGGIILTLCLIGIGIFLCKYCQHVCEDKYRTL